MQKVPFHKKRWLVPSKIQKDLIIYIICLSLLSQLALISHMMANDPMNGPYVYAMAILIKVFFVGYIIYGFWLSNRIVGPLIRLQQHMDEVADGKTDSEIQFRTKDYGHELAESFNAVMKNRINSES